MALLVVCYSEMDKPFQLSVNIFKFTGLEWNWENVN